MTAGSGAWDMQDQATARLAELKQEYTTGEQQLRELIQQEGALRETLLRISGAIQVLEELTAESTANGSATTDPAANAGTANDSAVSGVAANSGAGPARPGEVLTVP